jgi:pimeloyl-ACP methyl ester carboxylesterase
VRTLASSLVPTTEPLIINGRNDRVVPLTNAEFLDERLPNSRVVVIDGVGHEICSPNTRRSVP